MSDPSDLAAITVARRVLGDKIIPALSDQKALHDTISFLEQQEDGTAAIDVDKKTVAGIAISIILAAIKANASEIHIEPLSDKLRVRFRMYGVLSHYQDFPKDVILPLSSRLKIMCKANIAEKRRHPGADAL